MTTGLLDQRGIKVGDVLKYELDPSSGYSRTSAVVTVPSGGLSVGAVLESVSVAGKFTLITGVTDDDSNGVLLDENVYDIAEADLPGDFTLAVLTDISQVAEAKLSFGTGVQATAVAALEANANIKTLVQV